MFEALDKSGAGTVDIGVIVYKRITFDRRGDVIAEKPQLQTVTSWDRLRQVLLTIDNDIISGMCSINRDAHIAKNIDEAAYRKSTRSLSLELE